MGVDLRRPRAGSGEPAGGAALDRRGEGQGRRPDPAATELLDETNLNFVGNVEGKDVVHHLADVVVCDAVLGNVVIKFFEGLSGWIFDLFRGEFRGSFRGRIAVLLLRPGIRRIRDVFDYERAGGSPLLGVRGTVIITHGRARRRMVALRRRRRSDDGPDTGPGAHRRGVRRAPARRRADPPTTRPRTTRRPPGVRLVSGPELTVGKNVMREMVRLAAFEVPGVLRVGHGGPAWRALLAGRAGRRQRRRRRRPRRGHDRRPARPRARAADPPGPVRRRCHRRAPARPRARLRDGHGRRCRRLTRDERGRRRHGPGLPDGTAPRPRRGLRSRVRPADRRRDPRAPPGRARGQRDRRDARSNRSSAAVVAHRDTIDATIERFAPQYPVMTLARMDRALLRCGVGEVLHSPTPARVAIAEWVELARSYSGEPMRRLVNGVLGRISAEANEAPVERFLAVGRSPPEEGESVGHNVRPPQEDRR